MAPEAAEAVRAHTQLEYHPVPRVGIALRDPVKRWKG
jgi:hypothetical protein